MEGEVDMRTTLIALCAAVALVGALGSGAWAGDVFSYGGHYYFLTEVLNWVDAEAAAAVEGGHLVTVNDSDEHNWLVSTFTDESYWIGFHRPSGVDYLWASGEPVTFTNWVLDEPTMGEEYYVAMNQHEPGGWNDVGASWMLAGIAEVVPEPSSLLALAGGLLCLGGLVKRRA